MSAISMEHKELEQNGGSIHLLVDAATTTTEKWHQINKVAQNQQDQKKRFKAKLAIGKHKASELVYNLQ
jgi:hypothetical protein